MTYQEQLKHPKWQKKRLEILNRDKWTCKLCGDTETTLHVHHKNYESGKLAWEYDKDNYITLCEFCHKQYENLKKQFELDIDNDLWLKIDNENNIALFIQNKNIIIFEMFDNKQIFQDGFYTNSKYYLKQLIKMFSRAYKSK